MTERYYTQAITYLECSTRLSGERRSDNSICA